MPIDITRTLPTTIDNFETNCETTHKDEYMTSAQVIGPYSNVLLKALL